MFPNTFPYTRIRLLGCAKEIRGSRTVRFTKIDHGNYEINYFGKKAYRTAKKRNR